MRAVGIATQCQQTGSGAVRRHGKGSLRIAAENDFFGSTVWVHTHTHTHCTVWWRPLQGWWRRLRLSCRPLWLREVKKNTHEVADQEFLLSNNEGVDRVQEEQPPWVQ